MYESAQLLIMDSVHSQTIPNNLNKILTEKFQTSEISL